MERRLFGKAAPDEITVEDRGWKRIRGREDPWRVRGMLRLEVGDRGVLFLSEEPPSGRFGSLNDQAVYRLDGTDLADTDRTDPLVRQVEAMTVPELERLVDKAAAAVRQGTLRPVPEGGRRPTHRT